jgi:hypothetical protein
MACRGARIVTPAGILRKRSRKRVDALAPPPRFEPDAKYPDSSSASLAPVPGSPRVLNAVAKPSANETGIVSSVSSHFLAAGVSLSVETNPRSGTATFKTLFVIGGTTSPVIETNAWRAGN